MTSFNEDLLASSLPFIQDLFLKTKFNFKVILPRGLVLVRVRNFSIVGDSSRGSELKDERKVHSNISRYRPGEGSRLRITVK